MSDRPATFSTMERRQFRDKVGFIPERMARYLSLIDPPDTLTEDGQPTFPDDATEDAWWDRQDEYMPRVEAGLVGFVWLVDRRTNPELTFEEVEERPFDEIRAAFNALQDTLTEEAGGDPFDGTIGEESTPNNAESSSPIANSPDTGSNPSSG